MTRAPSRLFTGIRPCETGLAPVKSIETVFPSETPARAGIKPREMANARRVILGSRFHGVRFLRLGARRPCRTRDPDLHCRPRRWDHAVPPGPMGPGVEGLTS